MSLLAYVLRPSGPTHGRPPCSFLLIPCSFECCIALSLPSLTSMVTSRFRPSQFQPSPTNAGDISTGASASASKTRSSKLKATASLTPYKKAKKATRRSSSRIRIDEPVPKAPALTPPLGPRPKIPIHHSKWYTRH
jgi:hypothetical protein